jgi:small-conductance mechanosensitive channel
MTDLELEAELRIDQNALENVCSSHPELLYAVGSRLSILISQRDEAKQNLKETEARVDAEIRHDAEVAGDKITEKAVESQKQINGKVSAAKDKLFELEKRCGQMTALKEAFMSRGYAIRDLIQLYIANYYSSDMERPGRDLRHTNAPAARQKQAEHFRR